MTEVIGTNVIFYMVRDGVEVPICYAETNTLNISQELNETTRPPDSNWFDGFPGIKRYTISATGVMVDSDQTTYNVGTMEDVIINGKLVQWKMKDSKNPLKVISGSCYFINLSEDAAANDFAKFTLDCQGIGALSVSYIIPGTSSLIYYGTQSDNEDPTDFTQFITGDPNQDIIIQYGSGFDGVFFWMAFSKYSQNKNAYQDQNNPLNGGTIPGLFEVREITIGGNPYWLLMTIYETAFSGAIQTVRFYVSTGGVVLQLPTNLTASFANLDENDATIGFDFSASISPSVTGYEVRIINTTANTTSYYNIGSSLGGNITVPRGADYLIAVRAYDNTNSSAWTADIPLSIPAASQVQTIAFNTYTNVLLSRLYVTASDIVNTSVLVTYLGGIGGNRGERQITVAAGFNSAAKSFDPTFDANPVIISLSPTSFGNQTYIF